MNAQPAVVSDANITWELPSRGRVGMYCLISAESAIFTIFVVAYLFYVGKSLTGPTLRDVLHAPIFFTICLLSSSMTIRFAITSLKRAKVGGSVLWWFLTLALGATFLAGTAREWHRLIYHEGLTIQTNLFGTTYYSLVGLHAFHVTVGLVSITTVLLFALLGYLRQEHAERVDVLALYWHFVDAVWVIVFTVVYVVGR
jgi:cytochrome c oxidase subunit 3/cytochrome o ubiquinol oxidase subunit 3